MAKALLKDLASVIRSKNAGPYELTLDIIFKTREMYEHVVKRGVINSDLIGRLYKIPEDKVISVVEFAPARAIKVTIVRPLVCGDIGDPDVYGAQQHAPLLDVEVDWD